MRLRHPEAVGTPVGTPVASSRVTVSRMLRAQTEAEFRALLDQASPADAVIIPAGFADLLRKGLRRGA